ncbi:hypothetical protein HOK68_00875 [Candidatus Woesearchaeota archaeon]|jgi:uncharacterized protein|nr:hypothetical protein [Candidatus Woesearchaeota archaeon]MBT4596312.1 hypothetical protein [Candidatus Woesearchaeota archaeon]MBT5740814.1 hypothetical protein [Candidatus Woesearchaeota archaeon]MBT6505314.1 hypothetical protein [Candidatus Woesearchaeota archaeon]MBT7296779.1 hypothetical protein [Candidatus Woesearchaeota archaeon]
MEFKVLFSSDLHGNLSQYKKLFSHALKNDINAIIIGGDIAPKNLKSRTIEGQKLFFKNELFPLIKNFNSKNKNCLIYLMMGNDDFKSNKILLKEYENLNYFKLIDDSVFELYNGIKILGYVYVPLTPFIYKDWEKFDLNDKDEYFNRTNFIMEGIRSKNDKILKFKFDLNDRRDTIENDLNNLTKDLDISKLVLVTHSPPYDTNLDLIFSGEHVGSLAVKQFIEKQQPLMTLHGHIHETVDKSGDFKEIIGKTISVCSGNDHIGLDLAIIEFNLNDIKNSLNRKII